MFNYLNEKFISSNTKSKIELYILPLLILLAILIFTNDKKDEVSSSKVDSFEFENKKIQSSFLEISSNIENLAKKNSIFILKNEKIESEINLIFTAELNDIFDFLEQIERLNSFSNIKYITLKEDGNKSLVNLRVDFSKFYIKKFQNNNHKIILKKQEDIVLNKQNIQKDEISENVDFKLNAIVGQYALINSNWIKKDEILFDYKLINIFSDYIILQKGSNKIKLELNYAKHLKNSN